MRVLLPVPMSECLQDYAVRKGARINYVIQHAIHVWLRERNYTDEQITLTGMRPGSGKDGGVADVSHGAGPVRSEQYGRRKGDLPRADS